MTEHWPSTRARRWPGPGRCGPPPTWASMVAILPSPSPGRPKRSPSPRRWAISGPSIRAGITIGYGMAMIAPQEGFAGLTDSIGLARSVGDEWAVADGLKMMTIAWGARGDYDGALGAARELAVVANRLGNKFFLAWSHASVAYVALHRGDFATARGQLDTSIALCDDVGDPMTGWIALCWLGEVDAHTGDYVRAQARYEQVLRKGVVSDGDLARHWAIPDLGALLLALGDVAGAARVIEPAVPDFENEVPMIRVPFLLVYGELLAASGDEAGAHAEYERARQAASQVDNAPFTAAADYRLGQLARRRGESTEAEDLHHRALAVRHRERTRGRNRRVPRGPGRNRRRPGEHVRSRPPLRCRASHWRLDRSGPCPGRMHPLRTGPGPNPPTARR